jgi:lysophospholipase L1-like esterase
LTNTIRSSTPTQPLVDCIAVLLSSPGNIDKAAIRQLYRSPVPAQYMGALLAKMAGRPKLRILCFGDSLTAGYASWGAIHHPYNERMEQMLSMAFPDRKIETVEDGLSGATVKHGFQTRMNAQCG